jgi:hypothetical protein
VVICRLDVACGASVVSATVVCEAVVVSATVSIKFQKIIKPYPLLGMLTINVFH